MAKQRTTGDTPDALDDAWRAIRDEANALDEILNGNPAKTALWERKIPTIRSRLGTVMWGLSNSTYGPTQTHREQFDFAQSEFEDFKTRLKTLSEKTVPSFEEDVIAAGGPWVPGSKIP